MQRIRSLVLVIAVVQALAGCGAFINFHETDHSDSDDAPAPAPAPAAPTVFEGFVGGAFEVEVDGVRYADMEDFYTQELDRLPEKVQQAGYDASWDAQFDAQVGLADLWRDMAVYISPVDATGYQGQSRVDASGRFAVVLPPSAVGHTYKVRANKRIGILLTRGEARQRVCYNFSAVERSVSFADDTLPIILDSFATAVTAYDCTAGTGGLAVPPVSPRPTALALGQTKGDVTRIVGLEGLVVESTVAWCWAYRPRADSPCAADLADTSCDCRVTFTESGLVDGFDGVAPAYINP